MKVTDVIKMMLTSISYGRNITIDSWRANGDVVYDVSAWGTYHEESDDEEEFDVIGSKSLPACFSCTCYGLYDFMYEFNKFVEENKKAIRHDNLFSHLPNKYITDDELRHQIIDEELARQKRTQKYLKETKYITDWAEKNNPCPECKINKKDHWDVIHYKCEGNHTNTCPILKEFQKKHSEMYREYNERKEKEQES